MCDDKCVGSIVMIRGGVRQMFFRTSSLRDNIRGAWRRPCGPRRRFVSGKAA